MLLLDGWELQEAEMGGDEVQERGRQGSGWTNAEVSCQPPLCCGPGLNGEGWQAPQLSQGSRALAPAPVRSTRPP